MSTFILAYDPTDPASANLAFIAETLIQHELPNQSRNARRVKKVVNTALTRITAARHDPKLHVSLNAITDLQDAGVPVLAVLDVIEESWTGLQSIKHRFERPLAASEEAETHRCAVDVIAAVLRNADCPTSLRRPKALRAAIRCAWEHHSGAAEGFQSDLASGGLLLEVGFSKSDVSTIFSAFRRDGRVHIATVVRDGRMTGEEVLAVARNGDVVHGVEQPMLLLDAILRLRGRVRPHTFLATVRRVGFDAATKLHECTDSSTLAVRADELRKRHVVSLSAYLLTYGALREQHAIRFEDYVELTSTWPPDVVSRVFEAYPSVDLLRNAAAQGLGGTILRCLDAGVPWAVLKQSDVPLLRYLKARGDDTLVLATDAYVRCRANVVSTDALLALPASLHAHSAVHRAIETMGAVALSDRPLLELVVTVADAGYAVDLELLREFQRVDTWPNPQSMCRVYGLAQRFQATGASIDAALRRAVDAHDRLSPRKCDRAIRDSGYFRYRVLGETTHAATTPEPTGDTEPTAVEPTWDADDYIHRARLGRGDPAPVEPGGDGALRSAPLDLRTIHEHLDLRGLVPERVDAVTTAALILYGLCDLGKGVPFAGAHGIPDRHVFANVRRRFHPNEDQLRAAWDWLLSIGVISVEDRSKYVLDLSGSHSNGATREIARRTSVLLRWFREQTRLR